MKQVIFAWRKEPDDSKGWMGGGGGGGGGNRSQAGSNSTVLRFVFAACSFALFECFLIICALFFFLALSACKTYFKVQNPTGLSSRQLMQKLYRPNRRHQKYTFAYICNVWIFVCVYTLLLFWENPCEMQAWENSLLINGLLFATLHFTFSR